MKPLSLSVCLSTREHLRAQEALAQKGARVHGHGHSEPIHMTYELKLSRDERLVNGEQPRETRVRSFSLVSEELARERESIERGELGSRGTQMGGVEDERESRKVK